MFLLNKILKIVEFCQFLRILYTPIEQRFSLVNNMKACIYTKRNLEMIRIQFYEFSKHKPEILKKFICAKTSK